MAALFGDKERNKPKKAAPFTQKFYCSLEDVYLGSQKKMRITKGKTIILTIIELRYFGWTE